MLPMLRLKFSRTQTALLSLFLGMLIVSTPAHAITQEALAGSATAARRAIVEANRAWSQARMARDRATFEWMLAPDFYRTNAPSRATATEPARVGSPSDQRGR